MHAVCGQKVGRQNALRAVPLLSGTARAVPLTYVPTPLIKLFLILIRDRKLFLHNGLDIEAYNLRPAHLHY